MSSIANAIRSPFDSISKIDRSGLTGFGLVALIGLFVLLGGTSIGQFFDIRSIVVVFGGTLAAGLVNFSMQDLRFATLVASQALEAHELGTIELIQYFVRLAQRVRSEGVLILEREASRCGDPYLRRAFELAADGQQEADIRRILETERASLRDRENRAIQVFESLGTYSPALGLIGTLVGLIQMLGLLDSPSQVGPAMSLALLTTLYGAMSANLIFLPVAGKIRVRSEEDVVMKAIVIEGVLSLVRQEHSNLLEQRLVTFIPSISRQ